MGEFRMTNGQIMRMGGAQDIDLSDRVDSMIEASADAFGSNGFHTGTARGNSIYTSLADNEENAEAMIGDC